MVAKEALLVLDRQIDTCQLPAAEELLWGRSSLIDRMLLLSTCLGELLSVLAGVAG